MRATVVSPSYISLVLRLRCRFNIRQLLRVEFVVGGQDIHYLVELERADGRVAQGTFPGIIGQFGKVLEEFFAARDHAAHYGVERGGWLGCAGTAWRFLCQV